MSGLYQLPGLLLTALCHVIVIYHMAEHRYSRKKSCIVSKDGFPQKCFLFISYFCLFTILDNVCLKH